MQLILEERLTESLLNLTLASVGVLPAVEADVADDRIDVADHPLDHDRGVLALCFLEELGEGGLAAFFLLDRGGGWYHEAKYARSTSRFMMEPGMSINFVGFRVVLVETP
jgi:hypothetical protein